MNKFSQFEIDDGFIDSKSKVVMYLTENNRPTNPTLLRTI